MEIQPIPSTRGVSAAPVAGPPEPAAPATPQASAPDVDGSGVSPAMQRDERTGVDVVQFKDKQTGEVVSQLPTKAVLAMITHGQATERRGRSL
jgi:hypothetical protein